MPAPLVPAWLLKFSSPSIRSFCMTRLPREEIGYKKLYKNLDLDRSLDIAWPPVEENTVALPRGAPATSISKVKTLDEFDASFCKNNRLDESKFSRALERLDREYEHYLCARLDGLEPPRARHACDVCGSSDPAEDAAYVVCTGCQISVHKECYGVHEPCDLFWFCAKCLYYAHDGQCFMCAHRGGILKQTDDQRWVHMLCAVLNPSLSFANPLCKEPVDTSALKRRVGRCGICQEDSAVLLKCAYSGCRGRFHGSCAAESLYCDLNNKFIYCARHDFSSNPKRIWSRRNMVRHRSSYPRLENDVLIRVPQKLQKPAETEFVKIVKTEPRRAISSIGQSDAATSYWSAKRQAHGTGFTDIFFYINYLNRERKEGRGEAAEDASL